jgi:WD40 repeat protein
LDGTVRQWNLKTHRDRIICTWHSESYLPPVALAPDASLAATPANYDADIDIWDVATSQRRCRCHPKVGPVLSIVISSDNRHMVVAGETLLEPWDLKKNQSLGTRGDHYFLQPGLAFSADGERVALADRRSLEILDVRTLNSPPGRFEGCRFPRFASCLAFSPDNLVLAEGAFYPSMAQVDERTPPVLWDAAKGVELRPLKGHQIGCRSLAFSLDGRLLATGGTNQDAFVHIWEIKTGRELCQFAVGAHSVESLAFSSDGRTLASGLSDSTILLWDVTKYRQAPAGK